MMRRKVTIVLNEREPDKARAALLLEQRLHSQRLLVERLEITNDVFDILMARNPDILILDYVLGDVGTGLDMLELLKELPDYRRPSVIFFTDEPSVQVAVETLRNGAEHYLELGRASSFDQIVDLCLSLTDTPGLAPERVEHVITLNDCVLESEERKQLIARLQELHPPYPRVLFLQGPRGVGRETLVRAWAQSLSVPVHVQTIDCQYYTQSLQEFFTVLLEEERYPPSCIIVRGSEQDDHELRPELLRLSGSIRTGFQHLIVVCIEHLEEAYRLGYNDDHMLLSMSDINHSRETINALVEQLLQAYTRRTQKALSASHSSLAAAVTAHTWPGQIRQIKAVLYEALIRSQESDMSFSDALATAKDLWEHDHLISPLQPNVRPFTVVRLLHHYRGSMRQVAAHLGYSPAALHQLLDVYRSLNFNEDAP